MDFSYENNKGLHAFFLSLVMILGLFTFFAPVHSYAATSYPELEPMRTQLKSAFTTSGKDYNNTSYKEYIYYHSYKDGSKAVVIIRSGKVPMLDTSTTSSLRYKDSAGTNSMNGGGIYKRLDANGNVIKNQSYITDLSSGILFSSESDLSFTLTVPPKPFPGELAVKEVPGILAGQAGTIVLVGCLILGTLLVVGLVKRLISLFIR